MKTFRYKITLQNLVNRFSEIIENNPNKKFYIETNEDVMKSISSCFRQIKICFAYYNELDDQFTYKNDSGEMITEYIEEQFKPFPVNFSIMFIGKTGCGKSSLINQLNQEKKSLEGGTGLSTTSKTIIKFTVNKNPIVLYDVKGFESDTTSLNVANLINELNSNLTITNDCLNAIFYIVEYSNGTVIYEQEKVVFDAICKYKTKIVFIITKTPVNPYTTNDEDEELDEFKGEMGKIENAIKQMLKQGADNHKSFKNERNFEEFFSKYVSFIYVNLKRGIGTKEIFGLDKICDFFIDYVNGEEFKNIKIACDERNEEKVKELCAKNPLMECYSNFQVIAEKNRKTAESYLSGLKTKAFFTGFIPALQAGMLTSYRDSFIERMEDIYGFSLRNQMFKSKKEKREEILSNINDEVTNLGDKINESKKTFGELSFGKKARNIIGWIFFPITYFGTGIWASHKVGKECLEIINRFENAIPKYKFDSIINYINCFEKAVEYFKELKNTVLSKEDLNSTYSNNGNN